MSLLRYASIALLAGCACFAQDAPRPPSNPGYQALVKDAKTRIKEVTVPQLKELMSAAEKPLLIDIREDSEWQAGRAAGATHISRGVLEGRIEAAAPNKDAHIVLYCAGGSRSALAAESLQKMGYTNVVSLAGGFTAYRAAGLETAK